MPSWTIQFTDGSSGDVHGRIVSQCQLVNTVYRQQTLSVCFSLLSVFLSQSLSAKRDHSLTTHTDTLSHTLTHARTHARTHTHTHTDKKLPVKILRRKGYEIISLISFNPTLEPDSYDPHPAPKTFVSPHVNTKNIWRKIAFSRSPVCLEQFTTLILLLSKQLAKLSRSITISQTLFFLLLFSLIY